ncbi:unnamed protein product [Protopolystoma xenopodis]|uniref:Uncharacterized protein n=1 Tax=Protopolystoma xenopodis TaxID=117903 RepID=A0A448WA23_9PLAT|nr:unnamed protein product [Protopolystoma xenopodis]
MEPATGATGYEIVRDCRTPRPFDLIESNNGNLKEFEAGELPPCTECVIRIFTLAPSGKSEGIWISAKTFPQKTVNVRAQILRALKSALLVQWTETTRNCFVAYQIQISSATSQILVNTREEDSTPDIPKNIKAEVKNSKLVLVSWDVANPSPAVVAYSLSSVALALPTVDIVQASQIDKDKEEIEVKWTAVTEESTLSCPFSYLVKAKGINPVTKEPLEKMEVAPPNKSSPEDPKNLQILSATEDSLTIGMQPVTGSSRYEYTKRCGSSATSAAVTINDGNLKEFKAEELPSCQSCTITIYTLINNKKSRGADISGRTCEYRFYIPIRQEDIKSM